MNREKPRRCRAFEDDVEGRVSPDADDKAQANGAKNGGAGVRSTNSAFGTIELPPDIGLQSAIESRECSRTFATRSQCGYWAELVLVARLNASRAA
jgi:hypothetical protein